MDAESVDVTAGLGGFLAFFLLALALYFLMRNMNARMRRMAYREELAAKQTQDHDPDGSWFTMPMQMQKEIWPTEDFELALSYVPLVPEESDLFAGLGTPEQADEMATSDRLQITYDGRKDT